MLERKKEMYTKLWAVNLTLRNRLEGLGVNWRGRFIRGLELQ